MSRHWDLDPRAPYCAFSVEGDEPSQPTAGLSVVHPVEVHPAHLLAVTIRVHDARAQAASHEGQVRVGVAWLDCALRSVEVVPSPKSQDQLVGPPLDVSVKATVSGAGPDRGAAGSGFTHKWGDVVSIEAPEIGRLVNEVVACDVAEPWTFGTGALMTSLSRRGLLRA